MPHNTIKFVATDMDGTLLNEHGQLPEGFFKTFKQLQQKGVIFAAASGRQYYSLKQTFADIETEMMFIAENGTLVMHQDKELYSCGIAKADIDKIVKQARTIDNAHIVLCGKKSAYIETQDPTALEEIQKYYHRCEYVEDVLATDDSFIKVAICHFDGSEQHVLPTISDRFSEDFQVVVSAKIWLDVMNAQASKGAAIKHLQQTLGFEFEQTMSFGDYFNDIEMLQQSYHSYAMENAHDKVKAFARYSAPSNSEAGVIQILQSYLNSTS